MNGASPTFKHIVFDLDGTLIDSRADLATAVNQVRAEYELPPLSLDEVVARIGEGARKLVRRSLPPSIDGARFETAFESFRAHYRRCCLDQTRLYPGLELLLAALAPERTLAILTNKPEEVSRVILDGLGISGRFAEILGGDSLAARKPDPIGLLTLARRFAVDPADLTLIGDSGVDAATAHAAGSRFVLVEWGFATVEERATITADARVADAAALALSLGA